MAQTTFLETDDIDPIDIVEVVAEQHDWDFERITEDQIAMEIKGQWRTYCITLAWSAYDQTLRLICTYEVEPPEERRPALFALLNIVNDQCWAGALSFWEEQRLMVWRYGLILAGEQVAHPEQINTMITAAVLSCERYYPAFALVLWGDQDGEPYTPEAAINVAMTEAYGKA